MSSRSIFMQGRRLGLVTRLLALTLCLLLAGTQIGCSFDTSEAREADKKGDDKERGETVVPVEVAPLEQGSIEAVLRYSTNLEAEQEVQVFAEASRRVVELLVEEGAEVRRGDLLLRLQDDEQRANLAKVQVELEKVEREYERQKRLFAQDLISEEAFNNATYETEQLKLRLEDAERQLSYTEVRAPISGVVTQRLVDLGDTVTLNQRLFDISDFDSIVARVFVPERELVRLAAGQSARVEAPALGTDFSGRLLRIAPTVDPQSGTVKVTVAIPRSGNSRLRPGLYVDVTLVTQTFEDTLLVPKRALVYESDQIFVFRLQDGQHVERVRLVPELEDKFSVKPAGDALQAGDRLVIAGQAGLKDGAQVRVVGDLERAGEVVADAMSDDGVDTGSTNEDTSAETATTEERTSEDMSAEAP